MKKCRRRMVLDFRHGVGNVLDRLRLIHVGQPPQVDHLTIRAAATAAGPLPTDDQLLAIFQAVAHKLSHNLQTITLADFDQLQYLPVSCLDVLLRKCSCLTTLRLDSIAFQGTAEEFDRLAQALRQHPTLQDIGMSGLSLALESSHHATQFLPAMAKALSQLPSLRAMEIMETAYVPFWTGRSLAELCSSPTLQVLRIRGVRFLNDDDIAQMAHALDAHRHHTQLSELWILSCELGYTGEEGSRALAHMLQRNTSLELLGVNRLLCRQSALVIAQGLVQNQTLRTLHLCLRDGPDRGICEAYAQLLRDHNYGLETMSGSGFLRASAGGHDKTCSGLAAVSQIDFYLRLNRNGRRFLLRDENTVSLHQWMDALGRQNQDVSALFYWLSRNPFLCSD